MSLRIKAGTRADTPLFLRFVPKVIKDSMDGKKALANPLVLLREEFDDWAVLFDPDTCRGFGINPTGVYIWKLFDGKHSFCDLMSALTEHVLNVPDSAADDLILFIRQLAQQGLVGCDTEFGQGEEVGTAPHYSNPSAESDAEDDAAKCIEYQTPRLEVFTGERALGVCAYGSFATNGDCRNGNRAACSQGAHVGTPCSIGNDAGLCGSGNGFLLPTCNMGNMR